MEAPLSNVITMDDQQLVVISSDFLLRMELSLLKLLGF